MQTRPVRTVTPYAENRSSCSPLLLGVGVLLSFLQPASASVVSEEWIVHSTVRLNSRLDGPGPSTPTSHTGTWLGFDTGLIRGGFNYDVTFDFGTVLGNAQGAVQAQYERRLSAPGATSIRLGYAGLNNWSQMGITAGARVSFTPTIGYNVWPFGWADFTVPFTAVNVDFDNSENYTANLGTATVSGSSRHEFASVGGDLALASYGLSPFFETAFEFSPMQFRGVLNYEHVESGIGGSRDVSFFSDTVFGGSGNPISDFLDFTLNLDRPGEWEITLEDFHLADNAFSSQVIMGAKFFLGVPIVGSEISLEPKFTLKDSGDFELLFENHLLLSDTTLGRFSVHVDAVPVPAAVWLFLSGLIGLTGFSRLRHPH